MPDTTLNQTIAPRRRNVLLMVLGLVLAGCGGDEAPPAAPSGSLLVEQGPLAGPPALVSIALDGAEPATFEVARKQLPDTLPPGWHLEPLPALAASGLTKVK